ncbi:MAG: sigma-E factor negative regulatory protein [Rhodoferax sp.]|nr:sigma-E factor negative regulatory protein [Rhodoferax sp.]
MSDKLPLRSEWVSALVDGELRGAEFAQAIDALSASPQARQDWDTYQLVGAALRSRSADLRSHDPAFVARWRERLAREQGVALQPVSAAAPPPRVLLVPMYVANDRWWRRVVGVASVVAVAFGLWQGWHSLGVGTTQGGPALAQLAPLTPPVAAATASVSPQDAAVMLRDPRLDALLAAHRQHGGVTALQGSAGFLRNATFNEGSR